MSKVVITTIILFFYANLTAVSQRLPNLQKESLRAPADIKIDGKAAEWDNKFRAFNKSTEVFYSISNDDNRLYLTIQADRRNIINKIINGGIALTINKDNKKGRGMGASITFPVFKGHERPGMDFRDADAAASDAEAAKNAATAMVLSNLSINSFSRYIRTSNIPGVDTLLSVEKASGINASAAVDIKMALTVEFAIDLKLLALSAAEQNKLSYHIQLIAVDQTGIPEIEVVDGTEGLKKDSLQIQRPTKTEQYSSSRFNTDFTAEYTLAK
jgi:hypothetical protein